MFRYYTKLGASWAETGAISEKSSCHQVVSDIFATNAPRPPHGTLNSSFGEYRSVWMHLGSFRNYPKLGAIWAKTGAVSEKSSCHEVVSNIFTTNAPGLLHWTLNSW